MNWFNNLKTGVKILLSCLIFLIIISIIAGNGIFSINDRQKAFEQLYNENLMSILQMNRFIKNLFQIQINLMTQQIALKQNDIAEFTKKRFSINEIFQDNEKILKSISSANSASGKKFFDDLIGLHNQLKNTTDEFELALQNKKHKENDKLSIRWTQEYIDAKNNAETFLNLQQRSAEERIKNQKFTYSRDVAIVMALFLFAIIMSVFITLILRNSIVNPINKITVFADKLAAGDLSDRVALNRKDELGLLANALNKSAENLGSLIDSVLTAAQSLSQALSQIAGGNQNLSRRTSEQASAVEEIVAVIEETAITIKQNAGNAEKAEKLAKTTSRMSDDGTRIAGEAVNSINEINQSSKRIGEIISLINDISFQTNLLALNAAVEAARAGEQGKGFAVVAGEVRNLAQKSAKAAKDIDILIQNSIDKVENGTELVYKTGEALKKISQSNTDVTNIISEISAASREQKQGIDQINVVVSEIDTMTQQNAALVEETASASQQMTKQAIDLLAIIEKFKIKAVIPSDELIIKAEAVSTPEIKQLQRKHKKRDYERRKAQADSDTEVPPSNTNQNPKDIKNALSSEGFEEF